MATATMITADQLDDEQAAEFVSYVDSKIIPSVDELVEAAVNGGNIIEKEKIASIQYSDEADIIESVAGELEGWIKQASEKEEEGNLIDYQEKRAQVYKMAVVGTIFNTLNTLDENGQLDRLIEKKADKASYIGSFIKRFGAKSVRKVQKTKSLRGAAATSQKGARAAKMESAAAHVKSRGITSSNVGKGTSKVERAAKQEAVVARKQTRGAKKELAATQASKKRLTKGLVAGGVGASGLAYAAGASQKPRQRYGY